MWVSAVQSLRELAALYRFCFVWVIPALLAVNLAWTVDSFGADASEQSVEQRKEIDFTSDVRPILSDKCFFCHGPDPEERFAELRLDLPPDLQDRDPAIIAGDKEESIVWQRINDREDPMPPIESHKNMTQAEIEIIGQWIDSGAVYEDHWAYAPIKPADPPTVSEGDWSKHAVDRFIYDKLRKQELNPSPRAEPRQLLRRLYLDLVGLPPTPKQIEAFAADPSEQAYAEIVESLLASPRFGEHWAAWWLDLVRFGDSAGFHGDQPRSVWPYRDWVIRGFNDGMKFDTFTRMQLAGDKLEDQQGDDHLVASAYNRIGPTTAEGGAQQAEYIAIYAADRVANFGEVWLASSIGCARCHDHKYDPFTAADFYSLAAVFADIDQPIISNQHVNPQWSPYAFVPSNDEQKAQIAAVEEKYQTLIEEYPGAGQFESWKHSRDAGAAPPAGPWKDELIKLADERKELAKSVPYVLVTRSLPKPREVRLLPRGNWLDNSGPVMQPRPPEFLGGEVGVDAPVDRLELADWLFEENNPLTARVVPNRIWEKFFGRGITSNSLDFGNQGQPPTHRELLDYLATEFRNSDWDLRHLMRLMVMSEAYRQTADLTPQLAKVDKSNKWFARQAAKRLSAEVLRDQALAASGLLVNHLGGPSVFPYQPNGHWASLNFPKRKYKASKGDDLYRRSVYTWVQRTFPHPTMTVFDAPNRETCTAGRPKSNTPLQALTMLNEPLYVESARKLAERAMLASEEHDERIAEMFQLVLLRPPTQKEFGTVQSVYDSQASYFAASPESAKAICKVGQSQADASLPAEQLATYTAIGRIVLNLHETVTRP